MKKSAALYLPLGIGAALLIGLAIWNLDRPSQMSAERSAPEPMVRSRDRQPPPSKSPEAVAATPPAVTRAIDRAISAAAKRDKNERSAAVAELRGHPDAALPAIEMRMREAKNPEYLRQLDMLAKEVKAP